MQKYLCHHSVFLTACLYSVSKPGQQSLEHGTRGGFVVFVWLILASSPYRAAVCVPYSHSLVPRARNVLQQTNRLLKPIDPSVTNVHHCLTWCSNSVTSKLIVSESIMLKKWWSWNWAGKFIFLFVLLLFLTTQNKKMFYAVGYTGLLVQAHSFRSPATSKRDGSRTPGRLMPGFAITSSNHSLNISWYIFLRTCVVSQLNLPKLKFLQCSSSIVCQAKDFNRYMKRKYWTLAWPVSCRS